jgi:hypothetical protein
LAYVARRNPRGDPGGLGGAGEGRAKSRNLCRAAQSLSSGMRVRGESK